MVARLEREEEEEEEYGSFCMMKLRPSATTHHCEGEKVWVPLESCAKGERCNGLEVALSLLTVLLSPQNIQRPL